MQTKKRIEYLDAMRGLTMLLVVSWHVHYFSLGGNCFDSYNTFLGMIRMPLFFFVSGFLLDKPGVVWRVNDIVPFIRKKAKIQLIPTLFFMLVYCYLFNHDLISCLKGSGKEGYWFTVTLFEFFLVYSVCKMTSARFQYKVLFVVSLLFLEICRVQEICQFSFWNPLQFDKLGYFVYFSFGAYVKSHFSSFTSFLESKKFALVLLAFFGVAFLRIKGSLNDIPGQALIGVFIAVSGICIIFNFFRKYETLFQQTTVIGRTLQYIGKRTLDVYLLHYFFLPFHLGDVGDFFRANYNPLVEFVLSFLLSVVIVGICLVMSNVIRTSETLGHWLFGVKRRSE